MIKRWLVIIMALLLMSAVYVEAAEQKVVMEIEGMTCKLCPLAIKKSLSGVEGVEDVEVSLEEKKAWLTVEESVTNETLVDAVKKAGSFKGKVVERKIKE
jgi:mercuric ion binding protein